MNNVITAAQQKMAYELAMGQELGVAFHYCRQKLLSTMSVWDSYIVLFGHPERLKILEISNIHFAASLHWQILNGAVLGILRLLDPNASINKKIKNLTFQMLPDLCGAAELQSEVNAKLQTILTACEPLKKIREKIIAHNDFDLATEKIKPLSYSSRKDVTNILAEMGSFLNLVDFSFRNCKTHYLPTGDHGARSLLINLYYATKWREHRKQLALSNQIDWKSEQTLSWPPSIDEGTEDFDRYTLKI